MPVMPVLISEAHATCYFAFEELIETIKNPVRDFRDQLPQYQVQDEFDKYKLWAGNVGAAHSGKGFELSLDYRLRDANFYKKQVLKLLETLDNNLLADALTKVRNAISLIQNERKPFEELPFSASDYDEEGTDDSPWEISSESSDGNQSAPKDDMKTHAFYGEKADMGELAPNPIIFLGRSPSLEMPRILESIKFTITCLYKIPIRRPAPLDRLKTKSSIEASFYQHFDVLYVMDKFPLLDQQVATRLGKLITRRRQILAYRESHDQNLATDNVKPRTAPFSSTRSSFRPKLGLGDQEAESGSEVVRSQTPSILFAPRSKATTFKLRLEESHGDEGLDGSCASSIVGSELSRTSGFAGTDLHVEYPPRPRGDDGRVLDSFKCPYCLVAKMITSDHKWKKHVLEDLQPYVCTYPECELFDHFFKTQDEWYKHEAQRHRVKWFCNTDHHPEYETQSDFLAHLKQHHGTDFDSDQLSSMRNIFQRPSRAAVGQCNLCMRQSINLRSHVSRHLKQMALFALPRANETANSDIAELSAHSLNRNKMDEEQAALTQLRDDLRNACLECPLNGESFIPVSDLNKLVDDNTVRSILQGEGLVAHDQIEETTRQILQHSRKLFAILVDRDKTFYISELMEEGVRDENLPFIRRTSVGEQSLKLETSQRRHIKTLEYWDRESLKALEKEQYRMLAPLLESRAHHEFPELQTLPYIAFSTAGPHEGTSIEGGYGEVFQACIHPDHHNFSKYPSYKGKGLLVAVKRLYSSQESSFTSERDFHQALGDYHSHLHVIDLLCTYKKGQKYHLVFPWADGSLRNYWRDRPEPPFDMRTLLWSLKQMVGITSGLSLIHQFNDGTLFGRHGDIKADNILWFARFQDHDDPDGVLQIADMGLASFHRLGSRSNVNPASVTVPSTYSPPDAFRSRRISRSWDIWGLGCMYLEFVTWILLGHDAIEVFSEFRANDDKNPELPEFTSDCFYTTDYQSIRLSVFKWVDYLKSQEKCSAVIHDLLDLIMRDMIVLEPQMRISSEGVYQKLTEILKIAQENPEYLLDPVPVPLDRPLLDE